jgi:hypothetical protein
MEMTLRVHQASQFCVQCIDILCAGQLLTYGSKFLRFSFETENMALSELFSQVTLERLLRNPAVCILCVS